MGLTDIRVTNDFNGCFPWQQLVWMRKGGDAMVDREQERAGPGSGAIDSQWAGEVSDQLKRIEARVGTSKLVPLLVALLTGICVWIGTWLGSRLEAHKQTRVAAASMALHFFVRADSLVGEMDNEVRAICLFDEPARTQYDGLAAQSGALRTMALRNRPFVQDTVFTALASYYNSIGEAIFAWAQRSTTKRDRAAACAQLQQKGNAARDIVGQKLSSLAVKF
jgi:hypothetical protein